MSGIEAIGAIASISQLVQYSATLIYKLYELYRNVEQSGERYCRYKERINQLIKIARLVESLEEVLRSEIVATHVQALIKTTENIDKALRQGYVGDISKKWKKCLKAWQWSKAEEAILRGFEELERDKSCLTLCILGTYGSLITRIDKNLEDGLPQIQSQVGALDRTLRTCTGLVEEGRKIENSPHTFFSSYCSSRKCKKMHKANGDNKELVILGARAIQAKPKNSSSDNRPQTPSTDECSEKLADSGVLIQTPTSAYGDSDSGYCALSEGTLTNERSPPTRSWSENTAFDDAIQINGCVGKKDAAEDSITRCQWINNEARGQSNQVNGEVLDTSFAAVFFSRKTVDA